MKGTRRGNRFLLWCLLLATLLAGCASSSVTNGAQPPQPKAVAKPPVVAILDSGINPYNQWFAEHSTLDSSSIAKFVGAKVIHLSSTGEYNERVTADASFWSNVEDNQLYAFAGTPLLAIRVASNERSHILDRVGHGTMVAGTLLSAASDAFVVVVQVGVDCEKDDNVSCFLDNSATRGMTWVKEQPWIDAISVSLGPQGNPPMSPSGRGYQDESKAAAQSGKLIVAAAGNSMTPPLGQPFAGPPWTIAVGGVESAKGETLLASKSIDLVSDWRVRAPVAYEVNRTEEAEGTSFAAPTVAGALARALGEVRARVNDTAWTHPAGILVSGEWAGRHVMLGPQEFREALNATALLWNATDYSPRNPEPTDPGTLVLPVVSPTQMGWGYVNGTFAPAIARYALGDHTGVADKGAVVAVQQEYQASREAYWSAAPS